MEEDQNQEIKGNLTLEGISHITFNKDYTQCALTKKQNDIYIYNIGDLYDITTWTEQQILEEGHMQYVSGLVWSPASNKILSSSHDKSIIIWETTKKNSKNLDIWEPNHMVATTKLGFLFANWNNRGDKIVTGTSEKKIFIGYFNKKTGWWESKNFKVHKSSVVCAAIDPNSLFVISGSTDNKIFVTSCYIPDVDDPFLTKDNKGLKQEFGTPILKFDCGAWLNTVCWGDSGDIAFACSQNSKLHIIDYKKNQVEVIDLKHAPVQFLIPLTDTNLYCVTYDREILYYDKEDTQWELKKIITQLENNIEENTLPSLDGIEDKPFFIIEGPKKKHIHQADISSATFACCDEKEENKIITTDLMGFVKFWSIS